MKHGKKYVDSRKAVDASKQYASMANMKRMQPKMEELKAKFGDDKMGLQQAMMEPGLANAPAGSHYQFLRQGYFCADSDSRPGAPVFNRIVSLRDSWAKAQNA